MLLNKTNYHEQNLRDIINHDTTKWNDNTVVHEIYLCCEALYGDDEYGLSGVNLEDPIKNYAMDIWTVRLKRAIDEALKRNIISIQQHNEYLLELELKLRLF